MKTKITILSFIFVLLNSTLLIQNSFTQWQPDVRLTNSSGMSLASYSNARSIAANGNTLHVVWQDDIDGNFEIYYKRSIDGGITWGADTRLTNNTSVSIYPSIAVSGLNVHVTWQDERDFNEEIYYKLSADGGVTWGSDIRLTNNPSMSYYPSIASSGLNVHVVWFDYRHGADEIYYKLSADGGVNWGADIRLTNNDAFSNYASIAVSGLNVHVVWMEYRDDPNGEIYYKRSIDGGTTWGADTRLTNDPSYSVDPCIAVSGSNVHIVWRDFRNDPNGDVFYKHSIDDGTTWGADTRLTTNPANSENPSIVASGLLVHIAFGDYRETNSNIYYKQSFNNGMNWEADTRLTFNGTASSFRPSITASESNVHLVWSDERDGNYEIYYKRNPTGNVLPVNLFSFKSRVCGCDVSLNWTTSSEINNSGFRIERKLKDEEKWCDIAFISGRGTSSLPVEYSFMDKNLKVGKYNYRLKQIDYNGNFEYFNLENDVIIKEPTKFCLEQNYPNPFNPTTKIRFDVAHPLSYPNVSIGNPFVTLKIFDALGREVETLVNETLSPGIYSVDWNASGFPSGVYFYKLQAGDYTMTKRMTLIK